ncbi:MAG: hypothetical protein RI556_04415 [Hydrogenovibrio sp.]|uniref:hypothetical protein n=1 Tax=Hydrogenovibrio sp. TaxID=2065821 RepID=UPI0028702F8A|nr:hypothetical protein [Hydrogenovibrio sp.]MDR9498398.1 hypothetical protein [Hydrogenovibrio sp.]
MKTWNIEHGLSRLAWLFVAFGLLAGCEKPPVTIASAQIVTDMDSGSGNFDRLLKICFAEPIEADYWHKVTIMTKQAYKLDGGSSIRPLASDPDNPCHLRILYNYIHKDSPPGAREMIKEYMVPGNIDQLLIQVYEQEPTPDNKVRPIAEKLFRDL